MGNQITEKYLSDFREVLDRKEGKIYFSDNLETGFDWCGAFVYYCLKEIGYEISVEPFEDKPTFAYVRTWFEYSKSTRMVCETGADYYPSAGDLVIFRNTSSLSEYTTTSDCV